MPTGRPARSAARPTRRATCASASRRTGAASRRTAAATRTGPSTYLAYVPGYLIFGWTGHWDDLPAAHFTSILLDLLAIVGLALVGRRFGGNRLAATLAFAWAAYPFTQYVSNSNSNDAVMPVILIWGFWLLSSAPSRGAFIALAGWAKFSGFLLVPLWASYPRGTGKDAGKRLLLFELGFLAATLARCWVLFLEPDPGHAARVFWDRTFGWQLSRPSPFSIWDWEQYHYPDLALVQGFLKILLIAGACAVYFVPRDKSPLQIAALSAVAPDRLRDRAHALVLPLHPVVLPLRRDRALRHGPRGPGADRGAARR